MNYSRADITNSFCGMEAGLTIEERIQLAIKIAEGFTTDLEKIQKVQLELQSQLDKMLEQAQKTDSAGN